MNVQIFDIIQKSELATICFSQIILSKVVEAEKDDANLDKLMAALDEMGKVKEEDDNLLKSLRERYIIFSTKLSRITTVSQRKNGFERQFILDF